MLVPCALQRTPPYRPAALDVEEIREVGLDAHLETHRDRPVAVVREVVVLVDTVTDGAIRSQMQALRGDLRAVVAEHVRVGELETGRMGLHCRRVRKGRRRRHSFSR